MAQLYGFASDLGEAKLLFNSGITLVQFRNKTLSQKEAVLEAAQIVKLSRSYRGARVIVNDSVETALASGAYGVHLGQDDGDIQEINSRHREKLTIGLSIDTVQEALAAEKAGADYLGAGAVFGSQTKPEAPFMGIALLKEICQSVSVPVSAIGGITLENLAEVLEAGPEYICVISDINKSTNPEKRIKEYVQLIRRFNEK